jgi:LmbE family N-acetylglucosaminyl deacetylase
MCITAHPDDEAGGFGGALRLYAERGVQTFVLCLTPGQAASNRGTTKSEQELVAARRQEFAASCEILKVSRGLVLDYPDGQLHRQDTYKIACEVTYYVRQFRPQVVLTFGAEGGLTGHTDHSMAGIFGSLAYHWAGRENRYPDQFKDGVAPYRPQKLYYPTAEYTLPGRPPVSPPPTTTVIQIGDFMEEKIRAFKSHVTQAPLWPRFEENARKHGQQETFHLAAASGYEQLQPETDLFTRVREED